MKFTLSCYLNSISLFFLLLLLLLPLSFPERLLCVSVLVKYSLCNLTCGEHHQKGSMCKYYQSFLGRDRYRCWLTYLSIQLRKVLHCKMLNAI